MKDWECVTDIFSFFCISPLLIWFGNPDEGECGLFAAALCFPLLGTHLIPCYFLLSYQLNGWHEVIIA